MAGALFVAFLMTVGVTLVGFEGIVPLDCRIGREVVDETRDGFGVVLESAEGIRVLEIGFIGVRIAVVCLVDVSEMGGDVGVGVSDTVSMVETDLVSGGVVTMGEEATEFGERSKDGKLGSAMSAVAMGDTSRLSCFLSLPCVISASILRSESSSRSR